MMDQSTELQICEDKLLTNQWKNNIFWVYFCFLSILFVLFLKGEESKKHFKTTL
jgi:hypothetical protein